MGAPPKSLTRYSHYAGVSTVQVAARGEMIRDVEALSFTGRRKRDGYAEVQIDSRHGSERATVLVDCAEFLRMAAAIAALLDMNGSGSSQARLALQLRAQEYAEHACDAIAEKGWPSLASDEHAKHVIAALQEAFAVGYMRGVEGV
jgi:hypothetical protein